MLPDRVHTPAPLLGSTESTTVRPELAVTDRVAESPTVPEAGGSLKVIDWGCFWPLVTVIVCWAWGAAA